MTFSQKNRPPSRLFSWISHFARRSSNSDDGSSIVSSPQVITPTTTAPPSPPPPQPAPPHYNHNQHLQQHPLDNTLIINNSNNTSQFEEDDDDASQRQHPDCNIATTPTLTTAQPINVPRPSITLSVAGTIDDTLYSSSGGSSDSSYSQFRRGRRRPSSTVSFRIDDPLARLGTSFPESNKHTPSSIRTSPSRPASVFSLPTPNTRMSRDEPRPRLSCDVVEFQHHHHHHNSTSGSSSNRKHHHHHSNRERPMPPAPPPSPPPSALPKDNDWPRADRMIVRQELIKLALDGLFCSPLDLADSSKERNILHIGCGNGSWSMDMATKYKHCWVLGIDDRDVLDSSRATPRNFRFLKSSHGILHHLQTLPDNHFDFIYGRFLIFSYNPDHYREIVQECWRLCRSGGYVEMMELDMRIYGSPVVGPMTHMLNSQVIHLMEIRSLDPHFARYLQDLFFFHELVEQMHQRHGDAYHAKYTSLPLGLWGGRIGTIFLNDLRDLIETIHAREQNDYDPWTDRRLKAMLERVEEEFETHWAFMNLHHAYAQKL